MEKLRNRIDNKEAVIGVLGLGYVGLPLAVLFSDANYAVLGFELDESKKQALRGGHSYIKDIPASRLRVSADVQPCRGKIAVAAGMDSLKLCDVIIICVPTPLAKSRDPDLSYVVDAAKLIRDYLRPDQLVILESTTYPGTTRELILPILANPSLTPIFEPTSLTSTTENPMVVGRDFFLAFSPERVDPGNRSFNTKNTPKVIGGITKQCTEIAQRLYSRVLNQTVVVSSTDAAEMTKLLENTFRMINIGLVNEFSIMCSHLNVDVWEVIEAAATKPFGYIPFFPGPGLGGHCIPVDPHYLSWKLRLHDYRARFIELASEINGEMPKVVVSRIAEALNSRERSIRGSKILVLGVAYKKDIDDVRESPALDILTLLLRRGGKVSYHDPYVEALELPGGERLHCVELNNDTLRESDCVVLITDHSSFDAQAIYNHAQLVVDTRNYFVRSGCKVTTGEKLFKL